MAVYMTRVSWELFEIMVLIKAGSVGLVVQFLTIETEVVGSNPDVLPCKISFIMLMSVKPHLRFQSMFKLKYLRVI